MARLLVRFGDERLTEVRVPEAGLAVGRDPANDVVLLDDRVAPFELVLRRRGARVVALDRSGRGRTEWDVLAGEPIALGPYRLSVVEETAVEAGPGLAFPGTLRLEPCAAPPRGRPSDRSWRLLVIEGSPPGSVVLGVGTRLVGAAPGCDLVLSDRAVSARHCRVLSEAADRHAVVDLGSTNGTFLNGVRVVRADLGPGARLTVGRTTLRAEPVEPPSSREPHSLVGDAPALSLLRTRIDQYAPLAGAVLIEGESGTGKELVARLLHEAGPRRGRRFVAVNCGAIPETLVESTLFGHERGAFTGALEARIGAFEEADGGTLFLDEIGELPGEAQAKLLRALETGELRRIGGATRRVTTRVVAATNQDLAQRVIDGAFRRDLFFRLAVLRLRLPPLRDRAEDVAAIAAHLLAQMAGELGPRELSPDALDALRAHGWPGNVRELRNVLYRAAAATVGPTIRREDLSLEGLAGRQFELPMEAFRADRPVPGQLRELIRVRYRGNVAAAAREMGIPRSTLRGRLGGG